MKRALIPLVVLTIVGGMTPLWAQTAGTQSTQSTQGAQSDPSSPSFFDTVVVTATRGKEQKRDIPSNVTIIDQEAIKASTAQTLTDLIVEQGFNSASYNDTAGVQIRGFGQLTGPPENTNTVLILLNGRRTGNANLTLTGLQNVERIEIIRGPSAVQYGSSAMGGVINIITKRGTDTPNASFELGMGSDDLNREKLAFNGAAKGLDVALGVSNYGRSDLTTSGDRQWFHTEIDHNTNLNVDLGYSFNPNHRAGVTYNFGDIRSQLPSGSGIRPYSANTPATRFTDYQKNTDNTAFSYAGNTSNKTWDWAANYSFGNYDQKPFANNLDTKFFNGQADYIQRLFSASFGLDDYEYASDPSSWSTKDVGIYATGKVRAAAERLVFTAGLRYDSYTNKSTVLSADDSHTGGSVGVAYLPERWVKLRANFAEGFKVPSPQQVAGDGAVFYLPNLSLQPEASKTFEFGGDIDWQYVEAGLTWFHADWDNKITGLGAPGACSGGFGCFQYQNLKSSTLAGLEGSLSSDVTKGLGRTFSLAPYLSFTWLQTRRNNDSSQLIVFNGSTTDTLPNTPEWMVSYGLKYTDPRLKMASRVNAAYYGDLLTRDFSVPSSPYIQRPTGTVVNLSIEKELIALVGVRNKLTVRSEINNLFDGANEMYWGYPGSGRSFYLGLRYDY